MPALNPSALELVEHAAATVTTVTAATAIEQHSSSRSVFVDLREEDERRRYGMIPGAIHVPRGELEFFFDSANPLHVPALEAGKPFLLFCAGGWRSALAARTLTDLGVNHLAHIDGGFSAWVAAGGPVIADEGASDS